MSKFEAMAEGELSGGHIPVGPFETNYMSIADLCTALRPHDAIPVLSWVSLPGEDESLFCVPYGIRGSSGLRPSPLVLVKDHSSPMGVLKGLTAGELMRLLQKYDPGLPLLGRYGSIGSDLVPMGTPCLTQSGTYLRVDFRKRSSL